MALPLVKGNANTQILRSSFRDPAGFVFTSDGVVHRQVNTSYQRHYDHLMSSGLYEVLTTSRHLISHVEVSAPVRDAAAAYKVLRPEPVPFISYPYEWCFGQLKAAALATLEIQQQALAY